MNRRSLLKGISLFPILKDSILTHLKWLGFKQKSYYQIHGEIPFGNQSLPADGLFFFLDMFNKSKECTCNECNMQREYFYYRKSLI